MVTKATLTKNEAGGLAYELTPKQELAQIACTGTSNNIFLNEGSALEDKVVRAASKVDDNRFLAQVALYAREQSYMKDMPAILLAILSGRDPKLFHAVFDRVIDNGRMLRTLFTAIRSGKYGRKSLSYSLQRAFSRWLNNASDGQLLSASIGSDPSLRDVLRMARPTPKDNARRAFFGWITNKPTDQWGVATLADLPENVQGLMAFRSTEDPHVQLAILKQYRLRWDLISANAKDPMVWKEIARNMGHQALRMNLNTLLRHDVFENDPGMADYVAGRLCDPAEVKAAKQFPYQYFSAFLAASPKLPENVREALEKAAEIACGNIPELPGPVIVGLDVSGSMSTPVTGYRAGGTTAVRCVDAAALFAAAILRRNPGSVVIPFDTENRAKVSDANASILSLAKKFAAYGGGGTDCSLPLKAANKDLKNRMFDGIILISDNQSWMGAQTGQSTAVMTEWTKFVKSQTAARGAGSGPKLACIDIQPFNTTQAPERADVMNIGGFSDAVFDVISNFFSAQDGRFVEKIEAIDLGA